LLRFARNDGPSFARNDGPNFKAAVGHECMNPIGTTGRKGHIAVAPIGSLVRRTYFKALREVR